MFASGHQEMSMLLDFNIFDDVAVLARHNLMGME
jgi:hypothetical protein